MIRMTFYRHHWQLDAPGFDYNRLKIVDQVATLLVTICT